MSDLNVVVDDCVDEAVVVAALVDQHRHVVAQVPHDVALLLRELLDQLRHRPAEERGLKSRQITKNLMDI